jgi:hypothetical protein
MPGLSGSASTVSRHSFNLVELATPAAAAYPSTSTIIHQELILINCRLCCLEGKDAHSSLGPGTTCGWHPKLAAEACASQKQRIFHANGTVDE